MTREEVNRAAAVEGEVLASRRAGASSIAGVVAGVRAFLRSDWLTAVLLAGILVVALVLRLTHVNWDEGQHLHPDERFLSIISSQIKAPESVGQYFDSASSPLNPYKNNGTFVYGTLPIFLNKAVSEWLDRDADGSTHWTADALRSLLRPFGLTMEHPDGTFTFDDGYSSNQVGRVLSALADVLTIALLFELGRVLWSRRVGLLAAALLSLTVLHIQYSHFFGSETFLALFVTATLYFSVRIVKYESRWNYVWAGLAYGLALATKLSALPAIGLPALAVLIRAWPQVEAWVEQTTGAPPPWRRAATGRRFDARALLTPAAGGLVLLVAALLVFRVAQPYAFNGPGFLDVFDLKLDLGEDVLSLGGWRRLAIIDPSNYLDLSEQYVRDIAGLRNQQSGTDFPPNMQWIGRTPLLFPAKNIALWGLGLPLAFAAAGGMLYTAYRIAGRRDLTGLLPLVWAAVFFLFIARGFNPTMRYFIAIYPAMVLLAAYGLVAAWDFARSGRAAELLEARWRAAGRYAAPLLRGAVVIAVGGTALWALAFLGVYREDISRVQASYWIAENLPPGSKLTYNEWDDAVPLRLPGIDGDAYPIVTLKPYAQDSREKVEELVRGLDEADYVVETSNRVYDSVTRFPARFPSTVLYYRYLFDGTLGFEKVAEFTNYPKLLGVEIADQSAEEAFTVYDHPKVTIWRKTAAYSHSRATTLLEPDRAEGAVKLPPNKAGRNGLMLTPADLATQRAGGTWSDVFSDSGLAKSYPTLLWLLVLEAAALAVTPLTLLLFRRLPDRGYLIAKPLGLLLLAYPVWLAVSLKIVHFEQETVLGMLALLIAAGAFVAYRGQQDLAGFVRSRWRLILICEALFLLAFFFFRELRLENPDLWHPARGGEKPMDLAYLTAVARSTTLPPYDPWFAGGYINYYYLGQFFTATLLKLTTIPPEVGYNLAVPAFFAMTAGAAFSVSYNLAASARALLRRAPGRLPIHGRSVYAAGLLGAFFVALAGNLDGVDQLVDRLSTVSAWRVDSSIPGVEDVVGAAGGLWQVVFHGANLQSFDFWRPSRMLRPTISITEFPYFSFLFADLHAHMMAIPFELAAIGASLALALGRRGERAGRAEWGVVVLLALVVGSLRGLNSWDYPSFMLIALAAVLIGERRLEGGSAAAARRSVLKAALLVGLSFVFFLPFLRDYEAPTSGLMTAPEKTPVEQYLAHFGVFAAIIGAWLVFLLVRALRASPLAGLSRDGWTDEALASLPRPGRWWLAGAAAAVVGLLFATLLLVLDGRGFVAALLPVLALVAYLALREARLRRPDGGLRLFLLALVGLGLGLSIGVDLVTLQGDIVRMNTVFKFYMHAWIVFAVVSGFAAWYLVFVVWRPALASGKAVGRLPRLLAYAGSISLAILVLFALVYPLAATRPRLDDRFYALPPTLDGTEYMRYATYHDREMNMQLEYDLLGIEWLRQNVRGTPVIVEGRSDLYHWGSRFSIYTGLPTVLGWDWHQKQQRGDLGYLVDERMKQVEQFYTSPNVSQALAFLRQYDVEYVIVGQLERIFYPAAGLRKFATELNGSLEVAYSNPQLTVYRVKPEARGPSAALSLSLPSP